MADVKRIIDAIMALADAIPGTRSSTIISMHGCEAGTLNLLVAAGGASERYVSDDGTREWDCVTLYVNSSSVHAYSQHRPIARLIVDEAEAQIALDRAQAVLAE